ncbi:hypothetical protein ACK6WT_13610, partial [Escherichia coli]|nr:hypothetical protein [Escherichia coli]
MQKPYKDQNQKENTKKELFLLYMGYIWINTCIRRDNTAVLSARITFKGNLMMVRNEVMNKDWHREYIV